MDDLSEKLDRLLSSPDGMKRIEELMTAFTGAPSAPSPPTPPEKAPSPEANPLSSLTEGLDIGQLMKLMPMITQLQKEDDSAALLHALRPHLKEERQKRLDEAGQMLRLMKMLPMLKELSGKGDDNK